MEDMMRRIMDERLEREREMKNAVKNRIALVGFVISLPFFGYIGWDMWSGFREKIAKKGDVQ